MSQISDFANPWRTILCSEKASFRGKVFHVEVGTRSGGRRTVMHEYPKRSTPYAEDMGQQASHLNFTGYLIYRPSNPIYEYTSQRRELYQALEQDDAGQLVHPVFVPGGMSVMVERYSMTESRDRGGYTAFEMSFVQAGNGLTKTVQNTQSAVINAVAAATATPSISSIANSVQQLANTAKQFMNSIDIARIQ